MAILSYTLEPGTAQAGMIENSQPVEFETARLSEDLPADAAGRLVEWDPNDATGQTVRLPQGTTTVMNIAGALMYSEAAEPSIASPGNLGGPFKKGRTIQIMRKGRIWLQYVGTQPGVHAAPNVMHSSTIATDRGKITATATATTSGSEIQAGPAGMKVRADFATGIALTQLNFPV